MVLYERTRVLYYGSERKRGTCVVVMFIVSCALGGECTGANGNVHGSRSDVSERSGGPSVGARACSKRCPGSRLSGGARKEWVWALDFGEGL